MLLRVICMASSYPAPPRDRHRAGLALCRIGEYFPIWKATRERTMAERRDEAAAELAVVERQRELLARRFVMPVWFQVLYLLALLVLFLVPGLAARAGHDVSTPAMLLVLAVGTGVLSMGDAVLEGAAGGRLRRDRLGAQRPGRPAP